MNTQKKCNKCGEWKPVGAFTRDKRNRDGLQGICQPCRKSREMSKMQERIEASSFRKIDVKTCGTCKETKSIDEYYQDLRSVDARGTICKTCRNLKTEHWRETNRERYNATMRAYNAKHYQKHRLARYKLTPDQHAKMLAEQKGVCAICEQLPRGERPLCVDHDHSTGKVRGLLCYGCNRAIAILDKQHLFEKAALYLASKG